MISPRPRRNAAPGGPRDSRLRRITTMFGHAWGGPVRPLLYAANPMDEMNGIDEITGIVYPLSRLRKDGFGRQVADVRASTEPETPWLL